MQRVEVGDIRMERIDLFDCHMSGKVVYVHPKNRFYVVEFAMRNGGKFREAYNMIDR